MDQHHSYYPMGQPSVKCWRYICWWLFQSAMINAYIVFKETQKQQGQLKIMRHISFRLDVLWADLSDRGYLPSLCLWRVLQHQTPCQTQSSSILPGSKTIFSARMPSVIQKRDTSVKLWVSSVLRSSLQSPMFCPVLPSAGKSAMNRYANYTSVNFN